MDISSASWLLFLMFQNIYNVKFCLMSSVMHKNILLYAYIELPVKWPSKIGSTRDVVWAVIKLNLGVSY